jgi:hypothetical protein
MNNDQPIMWKLEEMISFCGKFKYIYIYGHGHDQEMLKKYLNMIDISVEGFILSDNKYDEEKKCSTDIKCSELRNRFSTYKDIGIIVGTWDLYFNEILSELTEIEMPLSSIHLLAGWNKRTISHKMTPRPKERMWIEVNLADHCNLNCQMCDHFSPLAEPTFLDLESFRRDMKRLAELTNGHIDIMKLQGGEPLLNDQAIEFIKITRELFPNAIIFFFTDGLLLKRWENHPSGNFWQVCHDYNVRIELTVYPIGIKVEEIQALSQKYDVVLDAFTEVGHRRLDGVKKSVKHPFDLEGKVEKWQFISCYQFNESITLRDGKLYTCPMIPYINHFNKYFDQNLTVSENDYIDIYGVDTYAELAEFVTHRTDFCRFCKVKERKAFDWKQSNHTIEEYV